MGALCSRLMMGNADQSQIGGKQTEQTVRYSAGDGDRYAVDPTRNTNSSAAAGSTDAALALAAERLICEGKKVVKALYDYTPTSTEPPPGSSTPDLAFKKDELMEVINEEGDWWLARSLSSHVVGYVPNTYVLPFSGLQAFDWFHGGIGKKDVDKLLTDSAHIRGTFLVRESETRPGTFALSLLEVSREKGRLVKHYRINNMNDGGCYISPKQTFSSIDEMIKHYSETNDALCCLLTKVCPRAKPQMWDLSRETADNWEIPRQEIQLHEQLGAGNFGEVWRGKWKDKIDVAVKTMKEGTMAPEKFLEEAEVMKKLRHPRLVTLFAVCTSEQPIYIVTELMHGGSLLSYLKKNRNITIETVVDMAAQIADGMRYIEREKHIHRDLAARNILVGEDNRSVKIGDFGLSRAIDEEFYEMSQGSKFPIKWTSPEAILYQQFTIKSDVWAYGILLVELTGKGATPYPGMRNDEVVNKLNRGYRHPKPLGCPDVLYDLMMDCWKAEAIERPTFEHLYRTLDDFTVATETSYKEPEPVM